MAQAKRVLWSKRMAQWECSGLTQGAFCVKHGVALSTFRWWRRRLADSECRKDGAVFLPLPMNPEPVGSATSVVEVELRSVTRLRFEGEAAQVAVRVLVTRVR